MILKKIFNLGFAKGINSKKKIIHKKTVYNKTAVKKILNNSKAFKVVLNDVMDKYETSYGPERSFVGYGSTKDKALNNAKQKAFNVSSNIRGGNASCTYYKNNSVEDTRIVYLW